MIYVILAVLGLCMGSFLHAMVWRIHAKKNFVSDRSRCDHCGHVLAWYDLIPVFSWLSLAGKCRYCHKKVTWHHPAIEIVTALLFVLSYLWWPYGFVGVGLVMFGLWLVFLVMTIALAVYDMRWMLLPDVFTFPLAFMGVIYGLLRFTAYEQRPLGDAVLQIGLGIACLAGLYWTLYIISRGKWVGFGDVKLGLFMGAALGGSDAIVALMVANVLGVLIVIPGLLSGTITRKSKLPFGPFLIVGFYVAGLFGTPLLTWYLQGFTG